MAASPTIWDRNLDREVEMSPEEQAFLDEIEEVSKRHGIALGHEDSQGAFVLVPCNVPNIDRLRAAQSMLPRVTIAEGGTVADSDTVELTFELTFMQEINDAVPSPTADDIAALLSEGLLNAGFHVSNVRVAGQ